MAPTQTTTTTSTSPPPLPDPWTTSQESALLKSLVHYKPIGLHAHFRILAIRNFLLQSGTTDAETPHTRIPGIWAKLRSLYDLEALNEREDVVFSSGEKWRDFELVGGDEKVGSEGFEALMWERRLVEGGTPGGSEWGGEDGEERSVVTTTATDEARSSPVLSVVGRGTRSGRKGRVNVLKDEMEVDSSPVGSGRVSRRTSKATSEVDEDQVMEDVDDDDEDEDGDESTESSDGQDGSGDRRGSSTKRGRGGRRGRGKRGRRRG